MSDSAHQRDDGTVTFLPHRLNRQPVIVRGMTADELWMTVGLAAALSLIAGMPLAILTRSIAVAPTLVVVGIAVGLFFGGGFLRRRKRGRPDTWLYRQIQWQARLLLPAATRWLGGADLINRSGCWTTRRSRP
ncbi:TIGR03750 family conjugal transfer protein [Paraburkholderia agricolaris]|jgi:conjugative transfer region protein (TIGR03750 family)|uniref:TIGR03750 family conjugal transfer protein n=1 Tax=Paraburkholderia agricolaris TaxID=2152888 RepID=A0ABW8ZIZ9_9BURK